VKKGKVQIQQKFTNEEHSDPNFKFGCMYRSIHYNIKANNSTIGSANL